MEMDQVPFDRSNQVDFAASAGFARPEYPNADQGVSPPSTPLAALVLSAEEELCVKNLEETLTAYAEARKNLRLALKQHPDSLSGKKDYFRVIMEGSMEMINDGKAIQEAQMANLLELHANVSRIEEQLATVEAGFEAEFSKSKKSRNSRVAGQLASSATRRAALMSELETTQAHMQWSPTTEKIKEFKQPRGEDFEKLNKDLRAFFKL